MTRQTREGRERTAARMARILENLRAGRPCGHGFGMASCGERAAYTVAQQMLFRRGLIRWTGTRWVASPDATPAPAQT